MDSGQTATSAAHASSDRRKCLLLEDDPDLTDVLCKFLEGQGLTVVAVTSGVEGLRHVMNTEFAVILCDLVMPNLPGDMFYLAVQRTKPQLCKHFVFMTGHRSDPKWDAFVRKVGGVMLWKPFDLADLWHAVESASGRTQ